MCSIEARFTSPFSLAQKLTVRLDGEWIQTIIDDKLYLIAADFDESDEEKRTWQQVSMQDPEEEYRKSCQNGSRALYFAQCSSENETWLPLLEKAYAKAHGDFNAIQGGFTGFVFLLGSSDQLLIV